jgi:hypothetical protein
MLNDSLQDRRLGPRERGAGNGKQYAREDQGIGAADEGRSVGAAPDDLGWQGVGRAHQGKLRELRFP